jgi:hypothetical protein
MQKILGRKLVNPEQVLDPIQNIAPINCCKEVFMVLDNAGTRKGFHRELLANSFNESTR